MISQLIFKVKTEVIIQHRYHPGKCLVFNLFIKVLNYAYKYKNQTIHSLYIRTM